MSSVADPGGDEGCIPTGIQQFPVREKHVQSLAYLIYLLAIWAQV